MVNRSFTLLISVDFATGVYATSYERNHFKAACYLDPECHHSDIAGIAGGDDAGAGQGK